MNAAALIAHVLAICAGAWGGWWLMGELTPDPPPERPAAAIAPASPASPEAPQGRASRP